MKILTTIAAYIFLFSYCSAQISDEVKTEFESYLNSLVDNNGVIGISAAVRVGADLWLSAAGKNSDENILTIDDKSAIGSITKTIASAVILDMMEVGELTLDDPISMYLSEIPNVDSDVSIRQLLNHTSGIFDYTSHPNFFFSMLTNMDKAYAPIEVLQTFLNPSNFPKGTSQEYSNSNYVLLGMIVKSISGNEFEVEFQNRYNVNSDYPTLRMGVKETLIADIAHLWLDPTFTGTGTQVDFFEAGNSLTSIFTAAHSAGAYVSKPQDLVNWSYDLYSGALLEANTMDSLFTFSPFLLEGVPYGLGVVKSELDCGEIAYGHGGNILYTANVMYVPQLDLSVAIMTNDGSQLFELGGVAGIAENFVCNYKDIVATWTQEPIVEAIISPNPASDFIYVEIGDSDVYKSHITIYNQLGKIVYSKEHAITTTSIEVKTDQLANGLYFIQVETNNSIASNKILIE